MDGKSDILNKIPIAEIKDGLIVMKDSSLRAILMVSSVNFSLKSTEEQDAITFRYQEFLNSLEFPIQILITTRKFDVSDYLTMLEQKRNEQENELLKIQTTEYIDFIKGLTQLTNIMSNFFYVIVPYTQDANKQAAGFVERLTTGFLSSNRQAQEKQTYEQMRTALWQRLEYIAMGLAMCGLKTAVLNDDELLELFYKNYNPEAKEKPKIEVQS